MKGTWTKPKGGKIKSRRRGWLGWGLSGGGKLETIVLE